MQVKGSQILSILLFSLATTEISTTVKTRMVATNSSEPVEAPPAGNPIQRKSVAIGGGAIAGIVCASGFTVIVGKKFSLDSYMQWVRKRRSTPPHEIY